MKKLFLACIVMILFALPAWADDCSNCPKDKPCSFSVLWGTGDMIFTGNTWCIDGKWYTDGSATVLPTIGVTIPIDNPFQVK